MARQLGADAVVCADRDDPTAAVLAFTAGRGAKVAFECAGGESMLTTLPWATRMARRGGAVVIVGGFDAGETAIPLDLQRIRMSEIRLLPSASFALHDIDPEQAQVLALVARAVLKTQPLITHRFPLERINEAFDVAQDKEGTGAIFVALEL